MFQCSYREQRPNITGVRESIKKKISIEEQIAKTKKNINKSFERKWGHLKDIIRN